MVPGTLCPTITSPRMTLLWCVDSLAISRKCCWFDVLMLFQANKFSFFYQHYLMELKTFSAVPIRILKAVMMGAWAC